MVRIELKGGGTVDYADVDLRKVMFDAKGKVKMIQVEGKLGVVALELPEGGVEAIRNMPSAEV